MERGIRSKLRLPHPHGIVSGQLTLCMEHSECLKRQCSGQDRDGEGEGDEGEEPATPSNDFVTGLLENSYRLQRPGVGEMRHGTEGWRCLETAFKVRVPYSPY
jgi:hypothetical protein